MTVKSRAALNTDADTFLADNVTGDISAEDTRQRVKDLADSSFNLTSDTITTVPGAGTAAAAATTDFATAAQGALADTAVQSVVAGTNITVDNTDPQNPIVSASGGGGSGDVVGPASAVNNGVALFDGITGKLIKDGGVLGDAAFKNTGTTAGTVAAGDDARFHDAVTLAGVPNYLTIAGQVITRALINLTSHVTGLVPVANGGTGASDAATARTNLGLGTIATQAASNVTITGGSITGITDLTVADGGTGRSSHTAFAVLCGGTTTTAAQQSIAGVGTSGQVLTSNGAGALPTFQAAGGGGFTSINIQTFTASGTYTPTAGMDYCWVRIWGAGGGGGGADNIRTAAGGGGEGGYAEEIYSTATIGASQTVTIGAGGTAGSNTGGNGGTGGTSSFGALMSATGGAGGQGDSTSSTGPTNTVGGAGGVGSGGLVNLNGQTGGRGLTLADNNQTVQFGFVISGAGGGSKGAPSVFTDLGGDDGLQPAGGGSGAVAASGTGNTGGVGGAGLCIVMEFI